MQILQSDALGDCEAITGAILRKISGINNCRKKFILHIFMLYMSMRGRYTFTNMERYGSYSEKSYRNQFSEDFGFLHFNKELVKKKCSANLIIAFDPSFIPKSGTKTDDLGWFWSGSSGKAKKGLEIGVIAAIDVDANTALSMEAIQTPGPKELNKHGKTLINHYAQLIIDRKNTLQELSKYLAVDGYFAKKDFVLPILKETKLEIISKLRTDADLRYLYEGPQTGRKGRPKEYEGKVDVKCIDKTRFSLCHQEGDAKESTKIYQCIVYSKTLKMKINVIYLEHCKNNQPTGRYAILFSTDLTLMGKWIYLYYKSRFQIEFLFRDAKQYCGLTNCQARDKNKMYFHYNTSLTAVSIAKAIYFLPNAKTKKQPFSMADIKTMNSNILIAKRIFLNLDFNLSPQKIKQICHQIIRLGCINLLPA